MDIDSGASHASSSSDDAAGPPPTPIAGIIPVAEASPLDDQAPAESARAAAAHREVLGWYGGARKIREEGAMGFPGQKRAVYYLHIGLTRSEHFHPESVQAVPPGTIANGLRKRPGRNDRWGTEIHALRSHNDGSGPLDKTRFYELATGRVLTRAPGAPEEWEHLINFWFSCFLEGPGRELPGLYMNSGLNKAKSDFIFNPVFKATWGLRAGSDRDVAFEGNVVPLTIRANITETSGASTAVNRWMFTDEMWTIIGMACRKDQNDSDAEYQNVVEKADGRDSYWKHFFEWRPALTKGRGGGGGGAKQPAGERPPAGDAALEKARVEDPNVVDKLTALLTFIEGSVVSWKYWTDKLNRFLKLIYAAFKGRNFAKGHARLPTSDEESVQGRPPWNPNVDLQTNQVTALQVGLHGTGQRDPQKVITMLNAICQYMGCIERMAENSYALRDVPPPTFNRHVGTISYTNETNEWIRAIDIMITELEGLCEMVQRLSKVHVWNNRTVYALRDDDRRHDLEAKLIPWNPREFEASVAPWPPAAPAAASAGAGAAAPAGTGEDAQGSWEWVPASDVSEQHRADRLSASSRTLSLGPPTPKHKFGKKQKRWVADLKGKKKFVRRQVYSMRKDLVTPSYFEKMTGADFWKLPVVK